MLHLNTLDYSRWGETTKQEDWIDTYNEGFKKLKKLQPAGVKDYSQFQFDLVMANPPFAGDIKENTIISRYELGKNSTGKWQNKVSRDVLFIERNLNFLKPGGRMAIVLPQGRFNNSSDKYIREFIAERCRILAVVGLHGNVFKPHTGTKTSVLFVQKWDDKLCPKKDDYPIFFATMQKPSKDNSGDKIYVKDPVTGENVLDRHGHLITERFYEKLFDAMFKAFSDEITSAKSSIPEKGNKRFMQVFDAMQAFCAKSPRCGNLLPQRRAFAMLKNRLSFSCLGLPATPGTHRLLGRDGCVNARFVIRRIRVPPPVVILLRNFPGAQLGGLFLPGAETLIKISRSHTTVSDFRAEADCAIDILYAQQLAILQREQRVH